MFQNVTQYNQNVAGPFDGKTEDQIYEAAQTDGNLNDFFGPWNSAHSSEEDTTIQLYVMHLKEKRSGRLCYGRRSKFLIMVDTYRVIEIGFQTSGFRGLDWEKFSSDQCDLFFKVYSIDKTEEIHGLECYKFSKERSYLIRRNETIMTVDIGWKNAEIYFRQDMECINSFFCQIFYTHAVQRHIIYLHSSLIDYQGIGLMFLGPLASARRPRRNCGTSTGMR